MILQTYVSLELEHKKCVSAIPPILIFQTLWAARLIYGRAIKWWWRHE